MTDYSSAAVTAASSVTEKWLSFNLRKYPTTTTLTNNYLCKTEKINDYPESSLACIEIKKDDVERYSRSQFRASLRTTSRNSVSPPRPYLVRHSHSRMGGKSRSNSPDPASPASTDVGGETSSSAAAISAATSAAAVTPQPLNGRCILDVLEHMKQSWCHHHYHRWHQQY
ncbi:hypothetical protein CHUAL_000420 [Chamberlinius hualienensis]